LTSYLNRAIGVRVHGLVLVEQAGHFPWLEQPDSFFSGLESALRQLGAISAVVPA
jgi:pimeloyl-ACP methyl ester carboxylesterase